MNTVVITGASGFLGSHLSRFLATQDFEVYAVSRAPAAETGSPFLHAVAASSYDISLIQQLPDSPSALIHLAWAGVRPEDRANEELQQSNVLLAERAVLLADAIHAQKFILPGSTMEYAYSGQVIRSGVNPTPANAYGRAKIEAKNRCEALCDKLSIPFIYLVISGIYSPDRLDSNVITYVITELLKGNRPSVTELRQKWDYVHIDDVCEAIRRVILFGKPGGFYPIGHGDNCPLSDYIFKIRDLIDPSLPLGIGDIPYEQDTLPQSCVDLTAIEEDTGFVPAIPFEKGIAGMIDALRRRATE